ncbi:MAG: hypothetical protein H8E66_27330 [Planctomycetes bacterium]|nr:hypothetical protein [Planctomycetota bacterium]
MIERTQEQMQEVRADEPECSKKGEVSVVESIGRERLETRAKECDVQSEPIDGWQRVKEADSSETDVSGSKTDADHRAPAPSIERQEVLRAPAQDRSLVGEQQPADSARSPDRDTAAIVQHYQELGGRPRQTGNFQWDLHENGTAATAFKTEEARILEPGDPRLIDLDKSLRVEEPSERRSLEDASISTADSDVREPEKEHEQGKVLSEMAAAETVPHESKEWLGGETVNSDTADGWLLESVYESQLDYFGDENTTKDALSSFAGQPEFRAFDDRQIFVRCIGGAGEPAGSYWRPIEEANRFVDKDGRVVEALLRGETALARDFQDPIDRVCVMRAKEGETIYGFTGEIGGQVRTYQDRGEKNVYYHGGGHQAYFNQMEMAKVANPIPENERGNKEYKEKDEIGIVEQGEQLDTFLNRHGVHGVRAPECELLYDETRSSIARNEDKPTPGLKLNGGASAVDGTTATRANAPTPEVVYINERKKDFD